MTRGIGLWLTCLLGAAAGVSRAADRPNRILLIGKERDHPAATHEYMHECGLLAKCLRQTPGIEPVVSDGWPEDPAALEGCRAVVLYTAMGGNVLLGPKARERAEALLDSGAGLVALHWSTGADEGPVGERYLEHLGGWFGFKFSKFLVRPSRLRQADAEHSICRGWKDFDLRDEYYIDLKFLPAARPLAVAQIDGKDYPMAWTFERPGPQRGRSFGLVCGHFHDCFADESFRRLIVNAILWSVRLDVPAAGAPCAVVPKDLELPPDPRSK